MNQMSAVMNKAKHDITQITKYGIFNCQLTKFEKSIGFIQYHCKTKAHLDFMNGGMQTIDGLQKKVMNSVNRSCLPYQTTADTAFQMSFMAGDKFSSKDEFIQFTELLNKQICFCNR